jgi:hypothetical protein
MCADRETFAEPPLGGVWEVRVADGSELVDGGHRHTTSQSFVERFHIDCYKRRHLFYVGGAAKCAYSLLADHDMLSHRHCRIARLAPGSVKSETPEYVRQCISKRV